PGKNGLKLVGQTSPFRLPYDEDPEPGISVAPGTPDNRADDAAVLKAATSAASSGANGMIWVRGARDVRIENLYIEVDASGPFDLGCFCYRQRSKEGVIATGDVNGLSIVNNYFKVVAGSGVIVIGVSVAGT